MERSGKCVPELGKMAIRTLHKQGAEARVEPVYPSSPLKSFSLFLPYSHCFFLSSAFLSYEVNLKVNFCDHDLLLLVERSKKRAKKWSKSSNVVISCWNSDNLMSQGGAVQTNGIHPVLKALSLGDTFIASSSSAGSWETVWHYFLISNWQQKKKSLSKQREGERKEISYKTIFVICPP